MRCTWPDRNGQWHSCHSRRARARRDDPRHEDRDPAVRRVRRPRRLRAVRGADRRRARRRAFVTVEPREHVVSVRRRADRAARRARRPRPGARPRRRLERPRRRGRLRRGAPRRDHAALAGRHAAGGRIGSVCTGAMLLAEAGLLNGRPAITHHSAIEDLRGFGADVIDGARVVDDGDIVTAAGVTSGIDLALHLVAARARCRRRRGRGRRDRAPLGSSGGSDQRARARRAGRSARTSRSRRPRRSVAARN